MFGLVLCFNPNLIDLFYEVCHKIAKYLVNYYPSTFKSLPQEFQVLQCYKCETFQVHQLKKVLKWNCKLCGEKQSVIKVYGRGSGPDCRRHVQQLNTMRGEIASIKEASVTDSFGYHGNPEEEVHVHDESQAYCNRVSLQGASNSKWSQFVDMNEDSQEPDTPGNEGDRQVTTDRNYFRNQRRSAGKRKLQSNKNPTSKYSKWANTRNVDIDGDDTGHDRHETESKFSGFPEFYQSFGEEQQLDHTTEVQARSEIVDRGTHYYQGGNQTKNCSMNKTIKQPRDENESEFKPANCKSKWGQYVENVEDNIGEEFSDEFSEYFRNSDAVKNSKHIEKYKEEPSRNNKSESENKWCVNDKAINNYNASNTNSYAAEKYCQSRHSLKDKIIETCKRTGNVDNDSQKEEKNASNTVRHEGKQNKVAVSDLKSFGCTPNVNSKWSKFILENHDQHSGEDDEDDDVDKDFPKIHADNTDAACSDPVAVFVEKSVLPLTASDGSQFKNKHMPKTAANDTMISVEARQENTQKYTDSEITTKQFSLKRSRYLGHESMLKLNERMSVKENLRIFSAGELDDDDLAF